MPRPLTNSPIEPTSLTRRDLGAELRNAMYMNPLSHPIVGQVLQEARVATAAWAQWYGNVEPAAAEKDHSLRGQTVDRWEQQLRQCANADVALIFNSRHNAQIPANLFRRVVALLGDHFLGFNEGEWDGAYTMLVANTEHPFSLHLSPQRSRREAGAMYREWLADIYAAHHHRMVTTCSLGFGCHIAAETGSRIIGLELGERLPCDVLMLAFCRGAARQYRRLIQAFPSVYSPTGVKLYPLADQPQRIVHEITDHLLGPNVGTSLGLLKQLWWQARMNGAALIGIQGSHFPVDTREDNGRVPLSNYDTMTTPVTPLKLAGHLTPLGEMYREVRQAARTYPLRCVPYMPVAILLDPDHGWSPQPNLYSRLAPDCVWGNLPWNDGDRQLATLFERFYPGYREAGQHLDERGKIVPTPYGDIIEVITADASSECLQQYQLIIPAGTIAREMPSSLTAKLEAYTQAGGSVLTPEDPHLHTQLDALQLVLTNGRPIHLLTSLTDRPDTLVVTLTNHNRQLAWYGSLHIPGEKVVQVEEWLGFSETGLAEDGTVQVAVPANDVRTYQLRTSRPFLDLCTDTIDWEHHGIGRLEPDGMLDKGH